MRRFCGVLVVAAVACIGEPPSAEERSPYAVVAHPFSVRAEDDVWLGGMELGRGGRPLIVLHGGPGLDHRYLRPALDSLAGAHWVIYMDQRGSGFSETELSSERISFEALIRDIERVRVWTGAKSVDLLGHSWGTTLALRYALRYPTSVNRLVLVSPSEPGNRYGQRAEQRLSSRVDPADQVLLAEVSASEAFRNGDQRAVSRYYELVFKPLLYDPDSPLSIPMHDRTARNGFRVMEALEGSMPDPDYWEALSSIGAPTLIVQGMADAYPPEMALEMASALGDGRVIILEEAGHFPYIEVASEFLGAVRAFLAADEGS